MTSTISDEQVRDASIARDFKESELEKYPVCENYSRLEIHLEAMRAALEAYERTRAPDPRVVELVEAARELSADLEHSIALANFSKVGTIPDGHPIRVGLNRLDNALSAFGEA